MLGPYQKFVTSLVTGLIGWGFVVIASAPVGVTAAEWMGLAVVAGTSLGVYAVPNIPAPSDDRSDTDE